AARRFSAAFETEGARSFQPRRRSIDDRYSGTYRVRQPGVFRGQNYIYVRSTAPRRGGRPLGASSRVRTAAALAVSGRFARSEIAQLFAKQGQWLGFES